MRHPAATDAGRASGDERGLSLAGLLVSLLVLALLAGGSVAALDLSGGGTRSELTVPAVSPTTRGGTPSAAGNLIDTAADLAAQQNLDTALQLVEQQAAVSGYAGIDADDLDAGARGLHFVTGPTTGDTDVSFAATDSGGVVTLAALSASGTCWYLWAGAGATWFGAGPGATVCVAVPMADPPVSSTPVPGRAGWQRGSFPSG